MVDTTAHFSACSVLLPRDAMPAQYMLSSCVCPSVCHTPVLYQNV